MFTRLAKLSVRRPRAVLVCTGVIFVVALVIGSGVIDRLSGSGFDDPGADSVVARAELDRIFDTGPADAAFLLTIPGAVPFANAVDGEAVTQAGLDFTEEIAAFAGTDDVISYWSAGRSSSLRSADGTAALLLLRFPGDANDPEREALSIFLTEEYEYAIRGPLDVAIGGRDPIFERIGALAEGDLTRAELIAIPLTLLLLIIVFRTVMAALLPVVIGIITIVGALLVLFAITVFADVSIFAINLVTALGLGLAIDYSLLIVNRYREEVKAGRERDDAIVTTLQTAGRTVAFSGLTVAVSLSSLLIFPLYFLRSFAYAGIGVIGFALAMSLVALPAALVMLGDRLESFRVGRTKYGTRDVSVWRHRADHVVERPWRYAIGFGSILALAAIPFLSVEWGESDYRALPGDDPVRVTTELLTSTFASPETNAFPVLVSGEIDNDNIATLGQTLSLLPNVRRVDSAVGSFIQGAQINTGIADVDRYRAPNDTWFNVVPGVEPIGPEAEALITTIRDLPTPFERVLVGGATASLIDTKNAILDNVPLAAGLIFGATFVLLFLMFGSIVVPIKAIFLNLLSLGATFGLMIVIFQEGALDRVLGFTATGFTDISTPILIFGIAFGLSMDYEVFLLSRIKEEYDRSGDNIESIVDGIDATGRIITAAALLLTVTFLAFATSSLSFLKLFGFGLATAVLVDAFIVRVTVVPAVMALAGNANWWAPRPLRWVHDRIGLREGERTLSPEQQKVIDLRAKEEQIIIELRERRAKEAAEAIRGREGQ